MISNSAALLNKALIVETLTAFPSSLLEKPGVPPLMAEPPLVPRAAPVEEILTQREIGDQVNGFLLCALVSVSAKRLKERAKRSEISLPMTLITRYVLRAYHLAAKDEFGPFTEATPDVALLRKMDGKILDDILAHQRHEMKKTGGTGY